MPRYEIKLKRQLRVDTETLAAGTPIAEITCDLPLRQVASLILNRGIVIGDEQVDVRLVDGNSAGGNDQDNMPGDGDQENAGVILLSTLELDPKLLGYLAEADPPITTVAQAREYLSVHGDFVELKGIGKAADKQLKVVLSSLPSA